MNINIFLIVSLIILYFLIVSTIINKKSKKNIFFCRFPELILKKDGIYFHSNQIHRIKIFNAKTILFENSLYIQQASKFIVFNNINDVKIFQDYLYFRCLGNVNITYDCTSIYKFFSIKITSKQFNLKHLKQLAIEDYINNNFEINFSKILKKYINIIENVLNIKIFKDKIKILSNKFNLKFTVTYKLNNKIKQVIVN